MTNWKEILFIAKIKILPILCLIIFTISLLYIKQYYF